MRTLLKWTFSATSLVLCVGLIVAWCTMFRGKPWQPDSPTRKGVMALSYGTHARSIEFTLNGDGLRVERNPSPYSYESDKTPPPAWATSYLDRPHWNWCGTGQDGYQVASEWKKAGFEWRHGDWQSDWSAVATTRPHFALMVPHWLLVAMTAAAPLSLAVSLIRRHWRVREGCCQFCGYDLTGNISGICPECGTPTAGDRLSNHAMGYTT